MCSVFYTCPRVITMQLLLIANEHIKVTKLTLKTDKHRLDLSIPHLWSFR